MAFLYNTTEEKQSVKAVGNWFEFKPGQIKLMNDDIGSFIVKDKKEHGIVALPQEFEEPAYKESEEGKAILAAKKAEGLNNYIDHLRMIVSNNIVSLRRDLEQANIKTDPTVMASDGELKALQLLSKYQANQDDAAKIRSEQMKELLKQIGK